jgi:hypothetical protein
MPRVLVHITGVYLGPKSYPCPLPLYKKRRIYFFLSSSHTIFTSHVLFYLSFFLLHLFYLVNASIFPQFSLNLSLLDIVDTWAPSIIVPKKCRKGKANVLVQVIMGYKNAKFYAELNPLKKLPKKFTAKNLKKWRKNLIFPFILQIVEFFSW